MRQAFGADSALDSVLPFVSLPMDKAAIDSALKRLSVGFEVIVQPPEAELPRLKTEVVLNIVRQETQWLRLLEAFRVDTPHRVEIREFSR